MAAWSTTNPSRPLVNERVQLNLRAGETTASIDLCSPVGPLDVADADACAKRIVARGRRYRSSNRRRRFRLLTGSIGFLMMNVRSEESLTAGSGSVSGDSGTCLPRPFAPARTQMRERRLRAAGQRTWPFACSGRTTSTSFSAPSNVHRRSRASARTRYCPVGSAETGGSRAVRLPSIDGSVNTVARGTTTVASGVGDPRAKNSRRPSMPTGPLPSLRTLTVAVVGPNLQVEDARRVRDRADVDEDPGGYRRHEPHADAALIRCGIGDFVDRQRAPVAGGGHLRRHRHCDPDDQRSHRVLPWLRPGSARPSARTIAAGCRLRRRRTACRPRSATSLRLCLEARLALVGVERQPELSGHDLLRLGVDLDRLERRLEGEPSGALRRGRRRDQQHEAMAGRRINSGAPFYLSDAFEFPGDDQRVRARTLHCRLRCQGESQRAGRTALTFALHVATVV